MSSVLTSGEQPQASNLLTAGERDAGQSAIMQIGDQIRAARRRLGWTQRQLAKIVGVSPGAVAGWEGGGGGKGISTDHLAKVARVLQLPVSELLGERPNDGLLLTDKAEIAVIELFRRLPPGLRKAHLRLLYEQVGGDTPHEERRPSDRRRVAR